MSDFEKIKHFLRQHVALAWGILAVIAVDYLFLNWLIGAEQLTLANIGALVISVGTLYLFYQRIKYQGAQVIDDRFTAAVNLLASAESSARAGGLYSLYHLAMAEQKYRQVSFLILCSHIRSKTQEEKYKERHGDRPSNEIQITIDLLFKNQHGMAGLYFAHHADLPGADLSRAHLYGADFFGANCQNAYLYGANCQQADFLRADCKEANFSGANCQEANFRDANCQMADFQGANTDDASFYRAALEGAQFDDGKKPSTDPEPAS